MWIETTAFRHFNVPLDQWLDRQAFNLEKGDRNPHGIPYNAFVAQLEEQVASNHQVASSSLAGGAIL